MICSKHYPHPNNKHINYSKHVDTLKVEFHIFSYYYFTTKRFRNFICPKNPVH